MQWLELNLSFLWKYAANLTEINNDQTNNLPFVTLKGNKKNRFFKKIKYIYLNAKNCDKSFYCKAGPK